MDKCFTSPQATGDRLAWNACHLLVDDGCVVHEVGTLEGGITVAPGKNREVV
jgi:hypothetical protein